MKKQYVSNIMTDRARQTALRRTAEHFGLTIKEVKRVIRLQVKFFKWKVASYVPFSDPLKVETRFQIPMMSGFVTVHKFYIIEGLYKHGHIDERQYEMLKEKFSRIYKKQKNKFEKYERYEHKRKEYFKTINESGGQKSSSS